MNDVQVMAFLTVADTLSFTKAANQMFVTQQAVSKYVNELEKSLNLVLFERSKTTVKLTPEGENLSRLLRELLNDYYKAKERIANHYRQMEFKLRIGISETVDPFGEIWGGINAFIAQNPGTVFRGGQVLLGEIQKKLDTGAYDLVIVSRDNAPLGDEYEAEPFAQERLCLYGPEKICTGGFDDRCWGLPLIQLASWEWGYFAWNRIGSNRLAKLNLHPERNLGVPNMESLLAEMRLSRFVTVADDRFGRMAKLKGFARVPLQTSGALCCVWRKSNENPLLLRFTETLRAYTAEKPADGTQEG